MTKLMMIKYEASPSPPSDQIKISLDGSKCAGVVKYSTDEKNSGYVCGDSWGKTCLYKKEKKRKIWRKSMIRDIFS